MTFSDVRNYLIGAGILLGSVVAAWLLVALSPEPPKEPPPSQTPLVSTTTVTALTGSLTVRGNGTVEAAQSIDLTAEVAGRLVSVSDQLVSGGRFEAGETLARVDPTDYRAAVRQAEARVTEARFQVLQAEEEVRVARSEYERLRERTGGAPTPDSTDLGRLIFKEPQLERARANLTGAESSLETARANLERTRLVAPFDGRVRTKQADLGAYVAPGTPVASIYSTETAEIVVPLTSREAALIEGLWKTRAGRGADIPATVYADYGGRRFAWGGYVHRVNGAIDTNTRTIDVTVRVPRPYNLGETGNLRVSPQPPEQPVSVERPPLQVGQYTTVSIQARSSAKYIPIPRRALRTRDPGQPPVVWTVARDSLLVERIVEPIQTVGDTTYLAPTFPSGTQVVTSDLRVHTDSMRVRIGDSR